MRSLSLWGNRPWRPLTELEQDIDQFLGGARKADLEMSRFITPCDFEETKSHYVLSMDVPGVAKDDLKIELQNKTLTISGERNYARKEDGSQHFVERSYGAFSRSFSLPESIDTEKIEADYKNGVLKVSIAKSEVAKPRLIKPN